MSYNFIVEPDYRKALMNLPRLRHMTVFGKRWADLFALVASKKWFDNLETFTFGGYSCERSEKVEKALIKFLVILLIYFYLQRDVRVFGFTLGHLQGLYCEAQLI